MKVIIATVFLALTFLAERQAHPIAGNVVYLGDCDATTNTLVLNEEVHKPKLAAKTRAEVEVRGSATISCITVTNQNTGGTYSVTDGGVGSTYVTIALSSAAASPLDYVISVYNSK